MNITVLGIDLAKNVFQLHGIDKKGNVVLRKRLKRKKLFQEVAQLPKCLIGIECCGGSNYWAKRFASLGHEVKQMNPRFVKPYVKSDKNDRNDAEAICEAVTRPNMRFAGTKTNEQQDLQSLHRIRSRLTKNRVSLSNQLRALLMEYGVIVPKGFKQIKNKLKEIFAENTEQEISPFLKELLMDGYREFIELDQRIEKYDKLLEKIAKEDETCAALLKIEGVGPKTATAIVAMVGNANQFKDGRQMAAYFGLVPKQSSSGGKELLLGITKRGDSYIRGLLIHGARSLLRHQRYKKQHTDRMRWLLRKAQERGDNKAIVAMANKQARVIWAVLTGKQGYRGDYEEHREALGVAG